MRHKFRRKRVNVENIDFRILCSKKIIFFYFLFGEIFFIYILERKKSKKIFNLYFTVAQPVSLIPPSLKGRERCLKNSIHCLSEIHKKIEKWTKLLLTA